MSDLVAICDSQVCKMKATNKNPDKSRGIVKEVGRSANYCPDCNAALLWIKVGKKYGQKKYFKKPYTPKTIID